MENKKIKILMVNPSGSLGGGNTVSNNLAMGVDKNIFEIFSFFPEKGLATSALKQVPDVNLLIPPKANLFSILYFLYNFLKGNKINIVHAQGTRTAIWARLVVILLKDKPRIIYTLHGFHIVRKNFLIRKFLLILERFLNRWTDVLICVSESDKNLVLKYKTLSSEKVKIIKNGIDIKKFQISQNEIQKTKKELELKNNFVLCSIGRLHPPKDFSTILKGLKIISSKIENIMLLIVGDGPLRRSLEKEKNDLRLNKYVKFLGWREDIPNLINLSDIVILSTKWEGCPLMPLEAGACKKPIIASGVDGVREVIIDKKTGYLFKLGSEEDLAEKILKLLELRELREKMGGNGFEFIRNKFSLEKMVENYQNLYSSILK